MNTPKAITLSLLGPFLFAFLTLSTFGYAPLSTVSVTITLNPGSLPNSPSNYFTVNYTQSGVAQQAHHTGGLLTINTDPSTTVSISGNSSVSGSSERWCLYVCAPVSFNSGNGISVNYYYFWQFYVPLLVFVGPGSPSTMPSVAYHSFGSAITTNPPIAPWIDASTSVQYSTDTLAGPNATVRYWTPYTTFTVLSSGQIDPFYIEQFSTNASYATSDNSTPTSSVSLGGTFYSLHFSRVTLTKIPQIFWWEWDSEMFLTSPAVAPSGMERWYSPVWSASDFGRVRAGMRINPLYYHQIELTVSYLAVGGGTTYSSPYFSAENFSSAVSQVLTSTPTRSWFDANSWSVTNPLVGSNSTERWALSTTQSSSGTASTPGTLSFLYYHQFSITLISSPPGGGVTNPTGQSWANATSYVQLLAVGQLGYKFVRWNVNSPTITITDSSALSTQAHVNGPGTITANFTRIPTTPFAPEAVLLATFTTSTILTIRRGRRNLWTTQSHRQRWHLPVDSMHKSWFRPKLARRL